MQPKTKNILVVGIIAILFLSMFGIAFVQQTSAQSNFGYTTKGSTLKSLNSGYVYYGNATASSSETISSITAYLSQYGADTPTVAFDIELASSQVLLGQTVSFTVTTGLDGWVTLNLLSPVTVVAGTNYLLGIWSDAVGSVTTYADAGQANPIGYTTTGFPIFPSIGNAYGGTWEFQFSIYASYSVSPTPTPTSIPIQPNNGSTFITGNYTGAYNVTASNLTPWAIQLALNNATQNVGSASGSIVFLPYGNSTHFPINYTVTRCNNQFSAVNIEPLTKPLAIFGAGAGIGENTASMGTNGVNNANATVLFCQLNDWNYTDTRQQAEFLVDGTYNQSVRISGICFQGQMNFTSGADDNRLNVGISLYCVPNFRIDHCTTIDFSNFGFYVSGNYVNQPLGSFGCIDHCVVTNPYKNTFLALTGNPPYWGYGVGAASLYSGTLWSNDTSKAFSYYGAGTVVVEDCSFSLCRHMLSGSNTIMRFDNFTDMILAGYGSYIDMHGGSLSEWLEMNNCNVINTASDYRTTTDNAYWGQYNGAGFYIRGAMGMCYNNTFINFQSGLGCVALVNDQTNYTVRTDGVWIWGNTYINVASGQQLTTDSSVFPVRNEYEYFLHAPNATQLTYTPLAYPFWLVSGNSLVLTNGNTYTASLTVTNPVATTYTSSTIPIQLSSSGNDTNRIITYNLKFSNGTWLYGSNQTYTTTTSMTILTNETNALFCAEVIGDNGALDYKTVTFSTDIVNGGLSPSATPILPPIFLTSFNAFQLLGIVQIVMAATILIACVFTLKQGEESNWERIGALIVTFIAADIIIIVGVLVVAGLQNYSSLSFLFYLLH